MKKIMKYIKNIGIALLAGGLSYLLGGSTSSFSTLNKPFLSPPAIVFPIVWTILYTLMGISKSMVPEKETNSIYYAQLLVNVLWTPIFFRFKWYLVAVGWLVLLIGLVIQMIKEFKKYSKVSAYLQIPYLIWLFIALYLNIGVYILN